MKDLILFLTHDVTSQKEAYMCEMRKFLYGLITQRSSSLLEAQSTLVDTAPVICQ